MEFKPHGYQKHCIEKIIKIKKIGLFLDMGLGKTITTLTAVKELKYNRFEVRKVLVIAPKKVAEGTWTKEKDKWEHTKMLRVSQVLGSQTKRIRNSETIYGGETEIPPELNMWEQILLKINGKADDMKLENDILQLFSEDNPIGRKIRIPPAGVLGREIELRNNGLAIQWRYTDSNHWKDLVLLSDIKGADGETPEFEIRNGHLIVKYKN